MAVLTRTHTRVYALLSPWASTVPWDCLAHETACCSTTHDHSPMVNAACAVDDCRKPLRAGEECYAVTEVEGWVCWRHVRPDDGPVRIR